MSSYGPFKAGGIFATIQSAAMGGNGVGTANGVARAGAVAASAAVAYRTYRKAKRCANPKQ